MAHWHLPGRPGIARRYTFEILFRIYSIVIFVRLLLIPYSSREAGAPLLVQSGARREARQLRLGIPATAPAPAPAPADADASRLAADRLLASLAPAGTPEVRMATGGGGE